MELPENFTVILVFASIIAVVATAITLILIVRKYKNKLKAPIYPIEQYASLNLTGRRDDFLHSNVTRVRVSSSNRNRR